MKHVLKKFVCMAVCLLATLGGAWAQLMPQEGLDSLTATDSNNQTWYFYVAEDGGAVISSKNWACGSPTRSSATNNTYTTAELVIPDMLTYNDVAYPVTTIGYRAFYNCTSITQLTIPATVSNIERDALDGCTSLAKFVLESSSSDDDDSEDGEESSAYYQLSDDGMVLTSADGTMLIKVAPAATYTEYEVPSTVTTIDREAFAYCSNITQITIGSQVEYINPVTFRNCSALTKFVVDENNTYYTTLSEGQMLVDTDKTTLVGLCASIETLTIPSGITEIGEGACYGFSKLTSVTIPTTVKTIGATAFRDCSVLETVTFEGADDGTATVDSIGYSVFYQCKKLNNFTLPASVEKIGDYAFDNCTSLTSFSIADDSKLSYIGRQAFYGTKITSFAVPASVTYIGTYAFYTRTTLTSLTFAENSLLETIDAYAFQGCTKLTSIDLSNCTSLTSLGQSCFYKCTGITSATLPSSITSLGAYCFYNCTSLESIDLSECTGLTSVSYACFYGCSALTSIEIPSTITSIDDYGFRGCTGLTSVDLSNFTSLKSLGLSSFNRCTSLTSITLPSSITSLGANCFYNCTALTSIDLSDCTGLESLGKACFNYCTAMTSIYLPSSITSLGEYCLSGCTALDTLVCYAESIPTAAEVALGSSDTDDYYMGNAQGTTKLYVPPYAMDTWAKVYETDVWKDYYTTEDEANSHLYPIYKHTIGSTLMSTLALPFTATIPDGISANIVTASTDGTTSSEQVYGSLAAGTPVVVVAETEGDYIFFGTESGTYAVAAQTTTDITAGDMTGTYVSDGATVETGTYNYVLSGTSFSLVTTETTISQFEAYLTATTSDYATLSFTEGIGWYYVINDDEDEDETNSVTITSSSESRLTANSNSYTGSEYVVPYTLTIDGTEYAVTGLGLGAFTGCLSVTKVTIPASVVSLDERVFMYCPLLTEFALDGENTAYKLSDDSKLIYTIDGKTLYCAATGATYDENYEIASTVETVGKHAFYRCTGLTSITLPSSVTTLADSCFTLCTKLASINLSSCTSLTSINGYCFKGCSALTSIDLSSCTALTSLGTSCFQQCTALTSITLPSSLTTLGDYCFATCTKVESIDLPTGITSLGADVFYYCTSLSDIEIPSGVTSIGDQCFYGCSSLTSIEIPSGVTSIGGWCFYNCSALQKVKVYAEDVPTLGSLAFATMSNWTIYYNDGTRIIYVPPFSLANYQAATNWSNYASYINPFVDQTVSGSAGMGTIALPFDATIPDGLTAYTLGSLNEDGTEVALSAVSSGETLAAGTPCIVMINSDEEEGDDETSTDSEDEEETTTANLECEWLGTTNALGGTTDDEGTTTYYTVESVVNDGNAYGVFQKSTLTTAGISSEDETSTASEDAESYTYYILQQHSGDTTPKFYKVGSTNVTVGAYRAYLAVSSSSSTAESIAFTFVGSDEVTGIGGVNAEQTAGAGLYYDLQGRQVRTPQKGGIYIKDGKKVVI